MSSTATLLLLVSLLSDQALAATKTTAKSSTRTGVSRTTVTKYKKKGKAVPWNQLSKGAQIAVYVVCGLIGLVLLVVLVLGLRK
jgi:hypothetical protein